MRIVHISDPHLSTLLDVRRGDLRGKRLLGYQSWYRRRRHQYQTDTLHQLITAVRSESADLVIVTGDLVQIGLASEMRQARSWLESLGGPDTVLVIPGNHDCYHRESWPLVQQVYGPYLGTAETTLGPTAPFPALRRLDDISIIRVSSARPMPWWSAGGTLGTGQRQRLGSMLESERGQFRLLAIHHPPLPGMATRRKALTDRYELASILTHTRPELIVHGHLHHNRTTHTAQGRIFCTAPPSSVRADAPASYRLFEIERQARGWQVNMTLKSKLDDTIAVATQENWFAESSPTR